MNGYFVPIWERPDVALVMAIFDMHIVDVKPVVMTGRRGVSIDTNTDR
jgi:hypothetical protein